MVISFLIATLILFLMNLMISFISIAQQYGSDDAINPFQMMTLGMVLIMITWNIFAIVYN
jgi:hypothetical protein